MNPIEIEERLRTREIHNSSPAVNRFLVASQVRFFQDINRENVLEYHKREPEAFWDVVRILGFLGVRFRGRLESHSSLLFDKDDDFLIYHGDLDRLQTKLELPYKAERFLKPFLDSFGLQRLIDIDGLYIPNVRRQMEKLQLTEWIDLLMESVVNQGFSIGRLIPIEGFSSSDSHLSVREGADVPAKRVRFEDEVILIPASMWELRIDNVFSSAVGRNVLHLQRDGITTYGQLPEDLHEYFLRKPQVGVGKIRKFKDELRWLIENRVDGAGGEAAETVAEEIRHVYVPSWLRELRVDAFASIASNHVVYGALIGICAMCGVERFGDLAKYSRDELTKLLKKPRSKPEQLLELLEKFYICLDGEEVEPSLDRRWAELRKDNEALLTDTKPEAFPSDQWEVLRLRLNKGAYGEEMTLQQIAEPKRRSRERIRQIEAKAFSLYILTHLPLLYELTNMARERGTIVPMAELAPSAPPMSESEEALLESLVAKCEIELKYDVNFHGWFVGRSDELEEEIQRLLEWVRQDRRWFEPTTLLDRCKMYLEKRDLLLTPDMILPKVIEPHFLMYESLYFPRTGTKKDLLLTLFEAFFPQGLAIIKNSEAFTRIAQAVYPEKFEDNEDRAIYSSLLRNEEEVLIWDNGYYVPRAFVTVPKEALEPMRNWTLELLKETKAPQIRLTRTIWRFKEELATLGITNEYALYTCFRIYFSEDFDFVKAPRICLKGQLDEARQPLSLMFHEYIKAQKRKVSKKEILDHFHAQLGWETYHIEQRMGDQVLRAGPEEYIHIDNVNVNYKGLEMVKNWLVKRLEIVGSEVVSIKLVNRAIMKVANVDSYELLYYLLEREYPDVFSFYIYPKLGLFDLEEELHAGSRRSKLAILDEKLRNEKRVVYRSQLEEFFKSIGWDNRDFSLITYHRNDMLVYEFSRNLTTAFVHKDSIGWTDEKGRKLMEAADGWFDDLHRQGKCLLNVSEILDDPDRARQLPALDHDIEWSEDLIVSLLKEGGNERFTALGLTQKVVVRDDNPYGIATEIDLIHHLLVTEFQGATSISLMESRLRSLRFIDRHLSKLYLNDAATNDEDMPYVTTPTLEIMTQELFRMKGDVSC